MIGFLAALALLLCTAAPAWAQTEHASARARAVQYVFIIDDSGSMRVRTSEGPAADPERLAIFGTRSMLSMLDDTDEVSLVRLNGPIAGEALVPIAPLSENRRRFEAMLALDGPIAGYPGKQTPCGSALAAVKEQLNAAYRPHVHQVVVFLTDGECTGPVPAARGYLRGLRAHDDGQFQFYFLRWRGRAYSRGLVELARETGGAVAEVGATDPTEILAPFAGMLSRSQGFESYLLTPQHRTMGAHMGARRVRLLAVAPDRGQELSFTIDPTSRGEAPKAIGATRTGVHQYEGGARYRFAALDYAPGTTPVTIGVRGAGNDWKIVAVPEYRLFVDMQLGEGRCGQGPGPGQNTDTNFVEVGASVCAAITLVNEHGQPVTSDVAGRGTEARVRYQAPGAATPTDLPAARMPGPGPAGGDEPRFGFERVNLPEGDHLFTPVITLVSGGGASGGGGAPPAVAAAGEVTIRGAARTLQVSTRRIVADPARFEFGELVPGSDQYHELTLRGNFPAARGRLVVENRKDVPECVRFELSGAGEGEPQPIHPGQTYSLAVHVAPYCGPEAYRRELETALRIEFDRVANAAPMPAVVVPFRATLLNQIGIPDLIQTTLRAGNVGDINVRLGGNQQRDVGFQAIFPPVDERAGWPAGLLDVVFVDARGEVVRGERGRPALSHEVVHEAGAGKARPAPLLTLRAVSDACCKGGVYRTELALVPTGGSRTPIRVPVEITVEDAGLWSCWGPTIVRTALGLLALLLVLYVVNMFRNSHFIARDRLSDRLVPLLWDDYGESKANTRVANDVRKMVRKNLTFAKRARAWFKANPLVFGLPGRSYDECLQLILDNSRNIDRSRLQPIEERDFFTAVQANPRQAMGRLYVTARGGMTFFCVPAEGERVGTFEMQTDFGMAFAEEYKPRVVTLRRRTEFLATHTDREPDTPAGWRVG